VEYGHVVWLTVAMIGLRRFPVTTFFVLAFLITWAVWLPRALASQGRLDSPLARTLGDLWTHGPAIAAVIAAALIGGRAELRRLGSRLVRWRVGPWWYAVVLLGPAAFWVLVVVVSAAFGGPGEVRPAAVTSGAAMVVPLLLALVLTDGLGEETGWRGFALPWQLRRFAPLMASLFLGLVWAVWHLPLFWTSGSTLDGASPWILVLELPAVAVLYTWVYLRTRGSALLAILFHASWNLFTVSAAVAVTEQWRVGVVILGLKWMLAAAAAFGLRAPTGDAELAPP
jgi:uncharacterized protein